LSHQLLITSLNRKLSKRIFIGPLFLGIILYLSGLLLFTLEGISDFYLKQWWIPLIIWAVSWMSLAFNWASGKFETIYTDALKNYKIDTVQSKALIEKFFSRVTSIKREVLFSLPEAIVFFIYILFAREGVIWIPPEIVDSILFRPNLLVFSFLLASITAYHMGVGALLVIEHIRFVKNMSKFDLTSTPLDLRCETNIHKLGRISLFSSLFWFVNVGVGVPLIITILDIITIVSLSALIFIGLLILLLPQIYLRKSILSYKKKVQCQIVEKFRDEWKHCNENERRSNLIDLFKLYDEVDKIEGWPFGKRQTLREIVIVILPLTPSIIPLLI
jgi:hypothetical protein